MVSVKRGYWTVPLVVTALAVSACGSSGQTSSAGGAATASAVSAPSAGLKVTVALTHDASSLDVIVATREGYFKQHGLNVVGSYVPTTTSLPEVTGKQFDVTGVAATQMIAAAAHGLPLVAISANRIDTPAKPTAGIIVAKGSGITSVKGLSGKTIGTPAVNGTLSLSTLLAVKRAGGNPSSVRYLEASSPQMGDLLKAGRFSAVLALEPFRSQLIKAGYTELMDPFRAIGNSVASAVYIATSGWVKEHPSAVADWRAAMQEADNFIAANPAKAKQILVATGAVPAQAATSFPLSTYATTIPPNTIATWLDTMKTYGGFSGSVDPAKLTAQ